MTRDRGRAAPLRFLEVATDLGQHCTMRPHSNARILSTTTRPVEKALVTASGERTCTAITVSSAPLSIATASTSTVLSVN